MSTTTPSHDDPESTPVRERDKILADCERVARRLKRARTRLQERLTEMSSEEFDRLVDQIPADVAELDGLLNELFNEMCWHNPELLARS